MSVDCLLTPSGFCESITSYEVHLDFRRNTTDEDLSTTGWYNYFPSINTTYCESTDGACILCDKLVNNGTFGHLKTKNVSMEVERQFCRGTNGCVCIMACESDHWKANMPVACDTNGKTLDNTNPSSTDVATYNSMLIFCLVLQVVLLAVFMYKRGLCRGRARPPPPPRSEGPYNNVDAITSPSNRLRLSGWRKMQNKLIERETKQRAVEQPQYMTSPRVEAAGAPREASTLMSPQTSARNSETEGAVYTQVQDISSTPGNSSLCNTRQASVNSDVDVAVRRADSRTERTSIA
ncbi:unnamed protein product [Peronospora farinosa]|uniref:Uncharacterized protein n=1 Tax=Peronospora farinosa TaxID=134698 RepID=A0AAV0TR13_9STRA|nr:unnamed protein product [Peronospora farinosa]CAI5724454.1 unnamed protein product [Peronospora farinosa]